MVFEKAKITFRIFQSLSLLYKTPTKMSFPWQPAYRTGRRESTDLSFLRDSHFRGNDRLSNKVFKVYSYTI